MPKVIFITATGRPVEVEAPIGQTLKDVAPDSDSIRAETVCGGTAGCLTCHCYPDEAYALVLPPMSPAENAMLDAVRDRRSTSRLACQIVVTDLLDGVTVVLPATR